MITRAIQVKAAVFDRIIEHLKTAQKIDTRRREVARTKIALRNIGRLYKEEAERIEVENK